MKALRTAKTRRGKQVFLDMLVKVESGWTSYVLDRRGLAVQVFVPAK